MTAPGEAEARALGEPTALAVPVAQAVPEGARGLAVAR